MNAKKENTKMTEQTMNDETEDVVDARPVPGEDTEESAVPDDAPEPQDGPQEGEEETQESEEPTKGSEAAKYRRRLRETEAERDALAEQVATLQRDLIDRVVTTEGRMHTADGFWAGVDLPDLLDEDGVVDHDKVLATVEDVARRFGIIRRPRPGWNNYVPAEGTNPHPVGRRMEDVIRGR